MGYYVSGAGKFLIRHDKVDSAYQALCRLNDYDHLKHGGNWPGIERPDGATFHPDKWFSWMDADYPSKCNDLWELLDHIGFYVTGYPGCPATPLHEDPAEMYEISLEYDSKLGQEELFLTALFHFVERGRVEFAGEDHDQWCITAENGKVQRSIAEITWVERSDTFEVLSEIIG
jgi:hypothetical protein